MRPVIGHGIACSPLLMQCPGAPAGVPLVHGLPSPELFDAAERGEVVLGGCMMVEGPTPRRACPRCGKPLGWAAATQPIGYEGPDGRAGSADPTRAGHLRVGTWNLRGYPHRSSAKGDEVIRWQEKLSADIWLLTEVHEHWGLPEGSWAVSPPREGAREEHWRWAGIQTRFGMTAVHDDVADRTAAEESLCLARIHLPEGYGARTVLVACSVLPWGGARKYWPVAGIDRLRAAFEHCGLRPLTESSEHLHPDAPTIDHLAVSAPCARGEATVHRPYYENGTLLSDHAAYTAEVEF